MKNMLSLLIGPAVFLYFFVPAYSDYKEIKNLCERAPSMGVSDVKKQVNEKKLRANFDKSGTVVVHSTKTIGQIVCLIEFSDEKVNSSEFMMD